jgi:hypothetical protein
MQATDSQCPARSGPHGLFTPHFKPSMTLLLLEALGALVLLVFIVWWTMFSGRKNGELPEHLKKDEGTESSQRNPD